MAVLRKNEEMSQVRVDTESHRVKSLVSMDDFRYYLISGSCSFYLMLIVKHLLCKMTNVMVKIHNENQENSRIETENCQKYGM